MRAEASTGYWPQCPGRAGRGGTLPSGLGGLSERPPQGVQPEAGLEQAPEGREQRG